MHVAGTLVTGVRRDCVVMTYTHTGGSSAKPVVVVVIDVTCGFSLNVAAVEIHLKVMGMAVRNVTGVSTVRV